MPTCMGVANLRCQRGLVLGQRHLTHNLPSVLEALVCGLDFPASRTVMNAPARALATQSFSMGRQGECLPEYLVDELEALRESPVRTLVACGL